MIVAIQCFPANNMTLLRSIWLVLGLLMVMAVPPPVAAFTAPSKTPVYRLLIVDSQVGEPYQSTRLAMLKVLSSAGFSEDHNLHVVYHSIGNDRLRGESLLREEIKRNYDVIFLNGTVATLAAKKVAFGAGQQPFVYACVTDPVGIGVIDAFNTPPKANFTGISYPVPVARRLAFLRTLLPRARRIGMIYADMPQSRSYRRWLEEALQKDPAFRDLEILFRSVPLVTGEQGSRDMAEAAEPHIVELANQVDVFLSPNDQMGVQPHFAQKVYTLTHKPLIGLSNKDVTEGWGATASVFPSLPSVGEQAAQMIQRLLQGEPISNTQPQWPANIGRALDLHKSERFDLEIPAEWILDPNSVIVH